MKISLKKKKKTDEEGYSFCYLGGAQSRGESLGSDRDMQDTQEDPETTEATHVTKAF